MVDTKCILSLQLFLLQEFDILESSRKSILAVISSKMFFKVTLLEIYFLTSTVIRSKLQGHDICRYLLHLLHIVKWIKICHWGHTWLAEFELVFQ